MIHSASVVVDVAGGGRWKRTAVTTVAKIHRNAGQLLKRMMDFCTMPVRSKVVIRLVVRTVGTLLNVGKLMVSNCRRSCRVAVVSSVH